MILELQMTNKQKALNRRIHQANRDGWKDMAAGEVVVPFVTTSLDFNMFDCTIVSATAIQYNT